MYKFTYIKLFSIVLCCGVSATCLAQRQMIEREMVFRHIAPNTPIQHTVTAVTPIFSAKCSADIPAGELDMSINGKKQTITPTKKTMNLSEVDGIPAGNGKNSYSYTILWRSSLPENTEAVTVTLNCIGKTIAPVR